MKFLFISYFLFLFFLLSFFVSGILDSQDGLLYLSVARNIYYKGEPVAPNDKYNINDNGTNINLSAYTGKNGKTYSPTGLGYSLALLPSVALTDLVYKKYHINPPVHFPLENDWLILLTASFTNAFFGALLGTILLLYFIELGLNKRQAIFLSLISIFATNLWVYTKHSLAHMMFITFLFLSFFLVKRFFRTKKVLSLIFAGAAFGVTSITYNQTFTLAMIPLFLYFILLTNFKSNLLAKPELFFSQVKYLITKSLIFLLGFLPFIIIYFWFENLKAEPTQTLANPLTLVKIGIDPILHLPISIFYEGLYSQLFSPGRSIFLYSPLLLVIIFFWHKIKKIVFPELVVFLVLSIIYISFYSTQFRVGKPDQGIVGFWHGESSWGPRYLLPLIPFGLLIVGHIYTRLRNSQKLLIFLSLVITGFYIEILGVLIPYQTKFYNLEAKFYVNGTQYTASEYSNLLPRYSPIISMSKNLVKVTSNFPKTFDHGVYNVKFYDGIDFPFDVGPERWRVIEGKGYISFNNIQEDPVKELTFGVINHPISESSESAKLQFVLNNVPLLEESFNLNITQREQIKVPIKEGILKPQDNHLVIEVDYDKTEVLSMHKQILGFLSFDINNQRQNMESIDIPYVSPLGPKMTGVNYQTWGGTNQDPWRFWSLHSQIFERVPDLWWIRNLYHWDIPKNLTIILFGINIFGLLFFGSKVFSIMREVKNA